jgi:hypothetical protein
MEASSGSGTLGYGISPIPGRRRFGRLRRIKVTSAGFTRDRTALLMMAVTLLAAALQGFFTNYRIAIFKVISYDNYAPYLLYLLGDPEGKIPHSPWVYRIGSVILAYPFYHLPLIPLEGDRVGAIVHDTLPYAKATQAICAASFFFVTLSCVIVFLYGRLRLKLSNEAAFVGSAIMFLLYQQTLLVTIDGIAALPITILAITIFERMTLTFAISILVSAFINEKIVLTAFLLVALRLLFTREHRTSYLWMTAFAAVSLLGYVAVVYVLHFPGNENHTDPSTYLPSLWRMLNVQFTAKGAYLTIWPALLLAGLWLVGMSVSRRRRLAAGADIGVIFGMLFIAFALGVNYNVGRIIMYSAPIFVITAMVVLVRPSPGADGGAEKAVI